MLEAIGEINKRLDVQDNVLRSLVAKHSNGAEAVNPGEEPSSLQWTDVVRKTKGRKAVEKPVPTLVNTANRTARSRPPAILVDVNKDDFPALAKKN